MSVYVLVAKNIGHMFWGFPIGGDNFACFLWQIGHGHTELHSMADDFKPETLDKN